MHMWLWSGDKVDGEVAAAFLMCSSDRRDACQPDKHLLITDVRSKRPVSVVDAAFLHSTPVASGPISEIPLLCGPALASNHLPATPGSNGTAWGGASFRCGLQRPGRWAGRLTSRQTQACEGQPFSCLLKAIGSARSFGSDTLP